MQRNIFIHSFQPVFPRHHLPQKDTVEWILKAHKQSAILLNQDQDDLVEKLQRYTLNDKYISNRYFECDDVDENWEHHAIYRLTEKTPHGATIGERNHFFAEKVSRVFDEIYQDKIPAHLVHVTCTGYLSPSPPQVFFSTKDRSPDITHAYHMGCYASLPSVRAAMGIHLLSEKDVDVVHTELCSLHLNPGMHSPEQMVVQTLFADGHIKYSIGDSGKGLRVLGVKEKLIGNTLDDMTWVPDAYGMKMTLSKEVPFRIRDSLPAFITELCDEYGVKKEHILRDGVFAIHPGGPKIIEAVQKKLELRDDQVALSKKVLFERGNMSSATLPHVWNEILNSSVPDGTKILSLAFGPGLTIFGSLFEVKR